MNGSTFVPIRLVSEGLGAEVTWDASNKTVVIITN
ncbi:stalk domain-containing protein [Paenibacillus sp. Soil766]|nr:stalk domain-containing protein [Paenibacillus sp. Soil766]